MLSRSLTCTEFRDACAAFFFLFCFINIHLCIAFLSVTAHLHSISAGSSSVCTSANLHQKKGKKRKMNGCVWGFKLQSNHCECVCGACVCTPPQACLVFLPPTATLCLLLCVSLWWWALIADCYGVCASHLSGPCWVFGQAWLCWWWHRHLVLRWGGPIVVQKHNERDVIKQCQTEEKKITCKKTVSVFFASPTAPRCW